MKVSSPGFRSPFSSCPRTAAVTALLTIAGFVSLGRVPACRQDKRNTVWGVFGCRFAFVASTDVGHMGSVPNRLSAEVVPDVVGRPRVFLDIAIDATPAGRIATQRKIAPDLRMTATCWMQFQGLARGIGRAGSGDNLSGVSIKAPVKSPALQCKVCELFNDVVPKTAENFRLLCLGTRGLGKRGEGSVQGESAFITHVLRFHSGRVS